MSTTQLSKLLFATLILCGLSSFAQADTAMLGASKDNTLFNDAAGALSNGLGELFAGRTGDRGPGAQRALLAFDIASEIPSGSVITDVQLTLTILQAGISSGNESYSLHRVDKDWGEGTSSTVTGAGAAATTGDATWLHTFFNNATWANPGGDFQNSPSATQSIGGSGPETWGTTPELVADVQAWLDKPNSNFGWILIGDESITKTARQFGSRESTTSAPLLTIEYTIVPEPCTLGLALLGMLGTALGNWRRHD